MPMSTSTNINHDEALLSLSLGSWEISFSPNVMLCDRPVVSLAVASLLNMSPDLTLISDPKRTIPCLTATQTTSSTPSSKAVKTVVEGDIAMAQHLVSQYQHHGSMLSFATEKNGAIHSSILPDPASLSLLTAWINYASTVATGNVASIPTGKSAIQRTLERALVGKTYLLGHSLTLADLLMYKCMGWSLGHLGTSRGTSNYSADLQRWMLMMQGHPAVVESTSLAMNIAGNDEYDSTQMDKLVDGMNSLAGSSLGSVCTRFPPEPSGFLHIGHAKATLLNHYYAKRYKGKLIVRFDDTNPSKEKEEYQHSIIQDLGTLQVVPNYVTLTSDYFPVLYQSALQLIHTARAYMDDTPQELMQAERLQKKESARRNMSIQDTLHYFHIMCSGSEEGSKWCLRAKIDMTSPNGTLRDPVIYRQNLTPHLNSGTTYKAYPTYDLACPIVDSIEGVSHALRTTEYNDRDAQYRWVQHALGIRRVRIHSFARMNFRYTELSKRKLAWFVQQGIVAGWDDARFPTIKGVLRRGVNVDALRQFILKQGASRRVVNMEWNKFWAENKTIIDTYAKRFMSIDANQHILLTITNYNDYYYNSATAHEDRKNNFTFLTTDYHPKNSTYGKRCVRLAPQVLLEKVDAEDMVTGELIVLMRWGVIQITAVHKEDGQMHLEGIYLPEGDFKAAKKKLTWIAHVTENIPVIIYEFDNLILKEKLEEDDNFQDFVNPNTCAETDVIGDAGLKTLQHHDIIQLERRGYFRVDRPYISNDKPLILFTIPDGKMKPMSGLTGKLAHR
jgi:glutamyl-tRNA synthetase